MWEMRGEARHHVSSKVLCWTALDRAVKLAPALGEFARVEQWAAARDEVREAVLRDGWSESARRYTQSFGSDELDAAALLMPIVGFLPATDPRMRSTIEAIASELTEDGLVLRYRNDAGLNADGLVGEEGTFVICSFWLVSASRSPARSSVPRSCSAGWPASRTISACSRRRSTPRAASCSATSPRRSATSGSSTSAWQIDRARERAVR